MNEKHMVTVFLKSNGTVLLLKRSRKVNMHGGKWSGVSGIVKKGTPLGQAMKELEAAAGLHGYEVKFVKAGKQFSVEDRKLDVRWVIHPFLFETLVPQNIHIDEDHTEFKWVKPAELELFETVPALGEALSRVL
jgi:8-oxo-dGTP diphosphatase